MRFLEPPLNDRILRRPDSPMDTPPLHPTVSRTITANHVVLEEHVVALAADRLTVLVADDEVHIVEFLALLLEDEGYQVLRAYDGLRAWELTERYRPDLVISDVMMPGLNGIDLARRIKHAHNGSAPPIVLMSAVTDLENVPGVRFLPKPFDIDHILELVAEFARGPILP